MTIFVRVLFHFTASAVKRSIQLTPHHRSQDLISIQVSPTFIDALSSQVRRFRTLMAFYVIELENIGQCNRPPPFTIYSFVVLEIGNTGTDAARTDQSTANQLSFLDSALYVIEQAAIIDLYRLKPKETLVSTLLDARSMLRPSRSSLGD